MCQRSRQSDALLASVAADARGCRSPARIFLVWLILVLLFTPGINYHLSHRTSVHDADFLYTMQSTCQAALHHRNRVEIFTNGAEFYPAMLEAIRGATRSINMERYIFQPGRSRTSSSRRCRIAPRHGVNVTIVVDAIGSFSLWGRPVRRLREAGCRIESYQRLRWYSLARLNNRTHRELLVVDGRVAFAGGAGIADWWADRPARASGRGATRWRASKGRSSRRCRASRPRTGSSAAARSSPGPSTFPISSRAATRPRSSSRARPSDRATASRVAFQLLMEGADHHVRISTPYFLPDRALRRALIDDRAARRRRSP